VSVLETPRLALREFVLEDAAFILQLLNEPGFLHFIGDKGVRHLEDARNYLRQGPIDSYHRNGFGLYAACLRSDAGGEPVGKPVGEPVGEPVGMCGLVKREGLQDPDVGYAFLQRHWGRGYAVESAAAAIDYGIRTLKLPRILAITSPDNWSSIRVLEKIGMRFERLIQWGEGSEQVKLFSLGAGGAAP
jgi:[ribosomal protein S5]-alanine N-acetyltransferase